MKHVKKFESFNIKDNINESLGVWIGTGAAMGLLWLIRKFLKHVEDRNNSWNRYKFIKSINQILATLKSDDLYNEQEAFQITEYAQLYFIKANIDSEEIMPDIRIMKEKGIPRSWAEAINDRGISQGIMGLEDDEDLQKKLSVHYLMFGNEEIPLTKTEHTELIEKVKELLK